MLIYNLTIKVDSGIIDKWKEWLNKTHLPEIKNTEIVSESKLLKLLDIEDIEGETYALQLSFVSKNQYEKFLALYIPSFFNKYRTLWGEKMLYFATLMEVVD